MSRRSCRGSALPLSELILVFDLIQDISKHGKEIWNTITLAKIRTRVLNGGDIRISLSSIESTALPFGLEKLESIAKHCRWKGKFFVNTWVLYCVVIWPTNLKIALNWSKDTKETTCCHLFCYNHWGGLACGGVWGCRGSRISTQATLWLEGLSVKMQFPIGYCILFSRTFYPLFYVYAFNIFISIIQYSLWHRILVIGVVCITMGEGNEFFTNGKPEFYFVLSNNYKMDTFIFLFCFVQNRVTI